MSKDLYLLVDGTYANPDDCDVGADNELRHGENGVPVALNEDGSPQTIKRGAIDNKNVEAAEAGLAADAEAAQINADDEKSVKQSLMTPNQAREESGLEPIHDENLLMKTDDLKTEAPTGPKKVEAEPKKAKAARPAKAKAYNTRELKAR